MKGCLIAFACFVIFLIILGVGCGGYVAFKGRAYLADINLAMSELRETNVSWPFESPPDGLLNAGQFERFLAVRETAEQPIVDLIGMADRLDRGGEELGTLDKIREAFGLLTGILDAFRDVPAKLNEGLRAQSMSAAEYFFVCETVHLTLIEAAEEGQPEAKEVVDRLEEEHEGIDIEVQDEHVSYRSMRRDLSRRNAAWLPTNLDLILANEERITGSRARILLDACVLQSIQEQVEEAAKTSER